MKEGEKYTEVTIVGDGSETIYELPVGNYTIAGRHRMELALHAELFRYW